MEQTDLVTFRAISNFLTDVSEAITGKYKPLALYNRLISKTTIVNEEPILKHVNLFKDFCKDNRKALEEQDLSSLKNPRISYSERVYFDIGHIFKITNKVDHSAIWKHLLIISTLTDKEGNSKNILKEMSTNTQKPTTNETNFINNMVEKVGESIDPNTSNPMDAVSSIMSSGIFNDLVNDMSGGIEKGDMNIGGLMGVVQNMMSSLDGQMGEAGASMGDGKNNPMGDMTGMMNTMMSSLGGNAMGSSDNPMGDMTNMMNTMMSSFEEEPSNSSPDDDKEKLIREQIEKDIENAYAVEEVVEEEPEKNDDGTSLEEID